MARFWRFGDSARGIARGVAGKSTGTRLAVAIGRSPTSRASGASEAVRGGVQDGVRESKHDGIMKWSGHRRKRGMESM